MSQNSIAVFAGGDATANHHGGERKARSQRLAEHWWYWRLCGAVFVHPPKTGGTSIEALLYSLPIVGGGYAGFEPHPLLGSVHSSSLAIRASDPRRYDASFTFAMARNPYQRLASTFWFTLIGLVESHVEREVARAAATADAVAPRASMSMRLDALADRLARSYPYKCEGVPTPPLETIEAAFAVVLNGTRGSGDGANVDIQAAAARGFREFVRAPGAAAALADGRCGGRARFRSQSSFMVGGTGGMAVNFVIHLETLRAEWRKVLCHHVRMLPSACSRALPHLRAAPYGVDGMGSRNTTVPSYASWYTTETAAIAHAAYARDFALLGYDKRSWAERHLPEPLSIVSKTDTTPPAEPTTHARRNRRWLRRRRQTRAGGGTRGGARSAATSAVAM